MFVLPADDEAFEAKLADIAPAYLHHTDPSVLLADLDQTILDAAALRQGFASLEGWSVADKLGDITAPALVGCGRHDLHTTPECSARLGSAIPGAELVWFEHSAHFPWLEEREGFNAAVRAWLSGLL
jgi:proline iminopeptidase